MNNQDSPPEVITEYCFLKQEFLQPVVAFLGEEAALRIPELLARSGFIDDQESESLRVRIRCLVQGLPKVPDSVDFSRFRYHQSGLIGRGGLGRVFSAYDPIMERFVALKEVLPTAEPEAVFRFLQEAIITGQLEHPAIIPVHEIGFRTDGTPFYTMKLVRGKTLASCLDACDGLITRLELLTRVLDVSNAVAYAHSRGIIHRDIKPSNILTGDFGETLLIDWGLAKVLRRPELEGTSQSVIPGDLTVAGKVMGTLSYMPWEQAAGRHELVDERSDVFALGALIYHLLAGRPPYIGSGLHVLIQAAEGAPPPVESLEPAAPQELVAICRKAMSRDRDARYANAGDLAEDLSRYLRGLMVGAYRYSLWHLVRRWVRRNRVPAGVSLAALVTLAVTVLMAYINIVHERDNANANLAQALIERARSEEEQGNRQTPGILYATALEYGSDPFALGGLNRMLQMTHVEVSDLWKTSGGPVSFLGGENFLVSGGQDGNIRMRDVVRGIDFYSTKAHDKEILGLAVSPSGEFLASASADETVRLWQWSGKELRLLETFAGQENPHGMAGLVVAFSPDSTRFVYRGPKESLLVREVPSGSLIGETSPCSVISAVFPQVPNSVLFSGWGCHHVYHWDLSSGELTAFEYNGAVESRGGAVSQDGKTAAFFDDVQGVIVLYDTLTKRQQRLLPGHSDLGTSAAFSPDGTLLLTSGVEGGVRLWNIRENQIMEVLPGLRSGTISVVFSKTGELFSAADTTGTVLTWRFRDRRELVQVQRDDGWILWAGFNPDGRKLALTGTKIQIFDLERGGPPLVHPWPRPGWARNEFSSDSRSLYVCMGSDYEERGWGKVRVFDTEDGNVPVRVFPQEGISGCRSLAVHPGGRILATAGGDSKVVQIWDINTGLVLAKVVHPFAHGVAFDPSGRFLATGGYDLKVRLWSTTDWTPVALMEGHEGLIRDVDFSADGRWLASAAFDGSVRVWEVPTGQLFRMLQWPSSRCFSVDFNPVDPRWLISTNDFSVLLWNVQKGSLVAEVSRHRKIVENARFSPDGQRVVTASDDGRSVILNVGELVHDPKDLVRRFQQICRCRAQGTNIIY